jgi:2-polyprenyl-3-methyl-5-hydroxy-6-metoxy-1,4-benzoquinol methylase
LNEVQGQLNMAAYHIVLVQPAGYKHSCAFWEIALLLEHSLASLELPCTFAVNRFNPEAVNIVLGYQLLPDAEPITRHACIIYQLEQLTLGEGWFNAQAMSVLKEAQAIWDYSLENIDFLLEQGLAGVQWVPVGFHENLQTIAPDTEDIDVLFYGSLNPRRKQVLDRLARECKVVTLEGTYGAERDRLIARSRIVLNLHYYDSLRILEQPRIAYLLNNGRFVLSEEASDANPYEGGLATAPYDQVVEACLGYLNDAAKRRRIADAGQALMARQPMSEILRAPLRRMGDLVALMCGAGGKASSAEALPPYFRRINPELLAAIPEDARLVVEIGCGAGFLGSEFKRRHPQARYMGIETHAAAASVAARHLDRVILADVEHLHELEIDWIGQADCLVYGDVLEHLIDPWQVLREHVRWLSAGGHVIASIPNVQHWEVLLGLLGGRWDYQAEGLLDRTHLRFFTESSIRELFAAAGLQVCQMGARRFPSPALERIHAPLAELFSALGEDFSQFLNRADAYQYIVSAVKAADERGTMVPSFCHTRTSSLTEPSPRSPGREMTAAELREPMLLPPASSGGFG